VALAVGSVYFAGVYAWKGASTPEIFYGLLFVGAPALLGVVAGMVAITLIRDSPLRWAALRPWAIGAMAVTALAILTIILGPE
jgi:hypothetical protein